MILYLVWTEYGEEIIGIAGSRERVKEMLDLACVKSPTYDHAHNDDTYYCGGTYYSLNEIAKKVAE